ncbi:hypothetical protein [Aeromonas jandaei]|uniref:hypothetical protein n=1 Tax=Aeromonas jandaei TaxID=650 RepID=UPI003BA3993D
MKSNKSIDNIRIQVHCGECGERYKLNRELSRLLEKDNEIACSCCGKIVKSDKRKTNNFWHICTVIYLILGAMAVMSISLYNMFSDIGFSSFYVSIPFFLSISLIAKIHGSVTHSLIAATGETKNSALVKQDSHLL